MVKRKKRTYLGNDRSQLLEKICSGKGGADLGPITGVPGGARIEAPEKLNWYNRDAKRAAEVMFRNRRCLYFYHWNNALWVVGVRGIYRFYVCRRRWERVL